jgi:hypothetical protein
MVEILFILFIPISHAQEANISIEHIGYGRNNRELYFMIRNTGEVRLTSITFYVDGQEQYSGNNGISPGTGIVKVFYLKSGEHTVEVKTLEGAHDSIKIGTPYIREKPSVPTLEEKSTTLFDDIMKNRIWIGLCLLLIIIVLIWLLTKKPRLM